MKTNKFVGMATVSDRPDLNQEFPYWGEVGKWIGIIPIEWIFIKDLYFEKIPIEIVDDQNLSEWKDGFELPKQ